MTLKLTAGVLVLAGTIMLAGCGKKGETVWLGNGANGTTVIVGFTLNSTAKLPVRINGVSIAAILPAGVSVATDPANPKQISTSALVTGSALSSLPAADTMVLGSYSSAGRLVRIAVATGAMGFGPGEFVQLTCQVASGTIVTTGGFTALNTPPVTFNAYGFDPVSHSTDDLTKLLLPQFMVR
jgi:hypothetical protein